MLATFVVIFIPLPGWRGVPQGMKAWSCGAVASFRGTVASIPGLVASFHGIMASYAG